MRIVPVILIAIGVLMVPLIWLGVTALIPERDTFDYTTTGSGIDSGARIEIERLRQQIEALQGQIAALQ